MIRSCIFLPTTENGCQTVIDKAQQNIDTILKPNLKQILLALDTKMAQNSIVVFNGYAQFFNTANEACAIEQSWILAGNGLMKLTIERRKKFNTLVKNINNAIQEVVDDITQNSNVKYKIGVADWDYWPREGVKGQFCDPSSTGRYPDPEQPDLQFFKLDTQISPYPSDELKRRVLEQEHTMLYDMANSTDIYNSLLYRSINPPAEALHKLDPRAPSPPNCPGDSIDLTLGLGLPDSLGKVFHPNELGHETISAFALETMISLRADILGVSTSVCEITEEFKCWQKEGRKGYANANRLNENYKDFCNHFVKQPENIVGWKAEKTYHKTTPEEHSFLIELSGNTGIYDKQQCLESFDRIINGCDGNDPKNPMNWKFGGRYVRGEYTYEVNIKRDTRPWPPIKSPKGSCEGWYYGSLSSYVLRGAGWSTWDGGQQTILPSLKACLGLGITGWHFGYYNEADYDGMEWEVVFNTPIWVRSRCFKNNKVAIASGGFTNGCGGNDW